MDYSIATLDPEIDIEPDLDEGKTSSNDND